MVFGVISAKIRMTRVKIAVAMAMPASPHSLIAITVAMDEASMLTKLLPINMTLMSWSVLSSRSLAFCAPLWPFFFRCFKRYLFRESIPVSELEKNPDRIIKNSKNSRREGIDASFTI